jgi:SET family sugar efflux transporter-like MFS transporter
MVGNGSVDWAAVGEDDRVTATSETRSPLQVKPLIPLASVSMSVGLATALALPFMSLFLTTEVGASPFALGAFLLISPLAGLVASSVLGRVSDRRAVRRNLLVVCGIAGAVGSVLFAVLRNYWVLLAVSVTLLAVASSLLAQMFAYAKQSVERDGSGKAPLVMSVLRTLISLAWVAGPPLAALLFTKLGFGGLYAAIAVLYGLVAVLTVRLPELGGAQPSQPLAEQGNGRPRRQIVYAALAFVLVQGASSLGVITMPLFITTELHGTPGDAGLILGLCAALEIPLILGFGVLAVKMDKHLIVCFGTVVALAYQGLMFLTTSIWQVAVLQVLSAVVVSAVMGVGITYFQALAPDQPGFASTLYSNTLTVGFMLAGPLLGLSQQLGYRTAYLISLAITVLGLVVLIMGRTRTTQPAT